MLGAEGRGVGGVGESVYVYRVHGMGGVLDPGTCCEDWVGGYIVAGRVYTYMGLARLSQPRNHFSLPSHFASIITVSVSPLSRPNGNALPRVKRTACGALVSGTYL